MATEDPAQALRRIQERAKQNSLGEEENSVVIEQRAQASQGRSVPATAKGFAFAIGAVKSWPQALVALAIIALLAFGIWRGVLSLRP